ncbi:MAG: RNA-directed DNA polymerase [Sedimenticola sp.]|nr:RNA-directed DNA polymerase [Sedimenticola sp.]
MSKLTEESLDFARQHIEKYYDSDFFPKPFEFEAIWHNWDEVKAELSGKNVEKLWVFPPHTVPAIKSNGTYRIVHQLEPVDAVIYTAMAYEIAESVEAARLPIAMKAACSYRLQIHEGSFFSAGGGYPDFDSRTAELANECKYILATDITDFYNQIYLHRLNNAIEFADPSLKNKAKDIESFLSRINGKTSQGIPVGPAASVVMSEALMTDVDQFLQGLGLPFTRYVDDIRIFSNDTEKLDSVLRDLTIYLYENHRLTLASGKTKIMEAEKYVSEYLHNPYDLEKEAIFESLEIFNPYTGEVEEHEVEIEIDEDEAAEQAFLTAIDKAINQKNLDVGLAKGIIRRARTMHSSVLITPILENFQFFLPVVSDAMVYINQIIGVDEVSSFQAEIESICASDSVKNPLARYWLEWFIAHHAALVQGPNAQALINTSLNIEHQAITAVTTNNIAWVRHMKSQIYNTSARGRRAILFSTKILPSDERNHWLKMTIGSTQFLIDKWVATWVLETT